MGTIVDFQSYRRNRVVAAYQPQSTDDAIVQAVMDYFKDMPITVLAEAINSARNSVALGYGFISAMDAATRTVAVLAPLYVHDVGSIDGIESFGQPRDRRTAALVAISERMIRAHMAGRPEVEIIAAVN